MSLHKFEWYAHMIKESRRYSPTPSNWHTAICNWNVERIMAMEYGHPKTWRVNRDLGRENPLFTSVIVSIFQLDDPQALPRWLESTGLRLSSKLERELREFLIFIGKNSHIDVSVQFIWLIDHKYMIDQEKLRWNVRRRTRQVLERQVEVGEDLAWEVESYLIG